MNPTPHLGERRLLIDGDLCDASSGRTFENVNPATEECIGSTADADAEDMERAIVAARRAFDETTWSTDHEFRARCIEQLCSALAGAKEELRRIVVSEAGAPLMLAYSVQCDLYIDEMPYWATLARSYGYETRIDDTQFFGSPVRRLLRREAAGVVGAITPWNFPLYLNLCKLGPALAAGNTVVLKPAPDTPWSATTLGRLIAEKTDIPKGVVNIVASSDHATGEMLASDSRVDMVTFTGSTATGRRVMAAASNNIKKVFLELGGKSANIVLDDADLQAAIASSVPSICAHSGQGCALATRLLLPRARYEEGIEIAKATLAAIPYGDPNDIGTLQGPLISARQRERVLGYIDTGRREGARLVLGGSVPTKPERGFFVEPTLFADVDNTMTIAREEIFGPVLAVLPYDSDDHAVHIANDSIYGLSGAITSASEERALSVARRIRTGTLSVNGAMWLSVHTPFGGYKQSGLGRENGVMGFEEYLETKILALPG